MANIDTNIFKNDLADAILVTPEEWSYEIEQYAREENYMRRLQPSVVVLDRIGSVGNSVNITKNTELSTSALTDGVATPIQALDFNQITVTASEHGGAVQFSKKQLRDQLPTIRADVIEGLGKALAKEEEVLLITEAMTSTKSVYPLLASGDEAASGTITTDETFNLETYNRAIVEMRKLNRTPMFMIVHPKVEGDLRLLADFRDASITGSSFTRESGFIGTYFGVNVFSSNNIQSVDEGAGADVPTYKNLLMGARGLVLMDKTNASLDIDEGLAIDRSMTFHVVKDYGAELLNEESIFVVSTA